MSISDDKPFAHPPTVPTARPLAEYNTAPTHCPLCARSLKDKWLSKPLPAKSIHGIVVCAKCRNGFATRRQAAYIVDAVLLTLVTNVIAFGLLLVEPVTPGSTVQLWSGVFAAQMVIGWLIAPLIFTCKDGFSGKSPGRMLCRVTVVDRTTREPIGFRQSFKRNLILMVPYLGIIWIALTMMKGRRVGDEWANTEVIWDKHRHKLPFDPRGILCLGCSYDLTGNVSGVCPECGTPVHKLPGVVARPPSGSIPI